ncbi:hypothetical protein EAV90_28955, partial [Bradyrhizobium vignae]
MFTLDAGVIVLLPPVIKTLLGSAPNVRLRAAQVGLQNLHTSLESGEIDLAIGEFPLLIPGIKRQKLFSGQHMCIFQKDHPRLRRLPSLADFLEEQHIFIRANRARAGLGCRNPAAPESVSGRCEAHLADYQSPRETTKAPR